MGGNSGLMNGGLPSQFRNIKAPASAGPAPIASQPTGPELPDVPIPEAPGMPEQPQQPQWLGGPQTRSVNWHRGGRNQDFNGIYSETYTPEQFHKMGNIALNGVPFNSNHGFGPLPGGLGGMGGGYAPAPKFPSQAGLLAQAINNKYR